jgi:hypothetical protein
METTSNALRVAIDKIKVTSTKALEIVLKSSSSVTSNDNTTLVSILQTGALSLADMKSFNRAAMFAVERGRQKVHASLADTDARHLQLQNLLYERAHLLRQIQKCREFPTPEFDKLLLVPAEETVIAAAVAIATASRSNASTTTNSRSSRSRKREREEEEEVVEEEEEEFDDKNDQGNINTTDTLSLESTSSESTNITTPSLPTYASSLQLHCPRLISTALLSITSDNDKPESDEKNNSIATELASLGPGELHELILAQLNHEFEQRKQLEDELEKAKARTSSLRFENKIRASYIDELPNKLKTLVQHATSLKETLLKQQLSQDRIEKEEQGEDDSNTQTVKRRRI